MVQKTQIHKTCESCRFWNENIDDPMGYGACQRHSPTINVELADLYYIKCVAEKDDDYKTPDWIAQRGWFPLTQSTDWCGEHQCPRYGDQPCN